MPDVNLTWRKLSHQDDVEEEVHLQAKRLEKIGPVIRCDAMVEMPHNHEHARGQFRVSLKVGVPGRTLVATEESEPGRAFRGLRSLVRSTFTTVRRQLEADVERHREITGRDRLSAADPSNIGESP